MENMLTNLVDKIMSLSQIQTFLDGNILYAKCALVRIKSPAQTSPATRLFNTLLGLVEYCKNIDDSTKFISVVSPVEVHLFGGMDPDNDNIQFHYAKAQLPVENFKFDRQHVLEDFIISLMCMFDETEDKTGILEVLSSLANSTIIENSDDKFSQSLQIKTGITTKANAKVKNPVILKPFRTFREVEQPSSKFILRYKGDGKNMIASLHEADGGAWQLVAIANIKAWLSMNAEDVIIIG